VDFVTLVMLAADPYETIAQGMANAAAAYKAEFNSLTEARISLSYGLTYPENLMKKHDKEKYAATGGWFWSSTWSSFSAFKGTFNNGAKDSLTSSLAKVSRMIQNSINYAFPLATRPLPHAIFMEQLLLARAQTTAWVDALEPLYEILSSSGMSPNDAWERVLIFTKAVFDDIRTVQALTLDKNNAPGMIWGSFRTTKLLEEYQRLKFYQNPHISNMLALTLLQQEGKKVEKALSTLGGAGEDRGSSSGQTWATREGCQGVEGCEVIPSGRSEGVSFLQVSRVWGIEQGSCISHWQGRVSCQSVTSGN
jgi:hypothetical protein